MNKRTQKELEKLYQKVDSVPFQIERLGHRYFKEMTVFSVFAPTTQRLYVMLDENRRYEMRKEEGTFTVTVKGDLEGHIYHYVNGDRLSYADPFSFADTDDGKNSYILDTEKFIKRKVPVEKTDDPVIYEISVRDFSSTLPCRYPKKFLALTEEGIEVRGKSAGLDYLRELGITHVQIMPVFSFDDDLRHGKDYNWGYNPVSYSTFKRAYIVDHSDPYAGVNEVIEMVNKLHEEGLHVVFDVVFNHVYDVKTNQLERMIPDYFFRFTDSLKYANGTYCGNEVRSEGLFARAYFKEIVRRYIDIYDIDGLRYDLMGIMDIDTVNEISELALSRKDDFLMYGEGWNMGDVLPEKDRASEINLDKIDPVGAFNRFSRDGMIAYTFEEIIKDKEMQDAFEGSPLQGFTPHQSINYVECHDNMTFYDRALEHTRNEEYLKKYAKFALALVAFCKGIPFYHSGQEFLRTKCGIDNSYNIGDHINTLDWIRRGIYDDVTEYFTKLLKIRKKYPAFHNETLPVYEEYYEMRVVRYGDLAVIINPCVFDHIFASSERYDVLFGKDGEALYDRDAFEVPAHTIVVAIRRNSV